MGKYFPFIILLYVSIEGTAEIKFIGISSKDALEIAISLALYETPSSCLND